MATQAPSHGVINDRQGRLTATFVDDRTLVTASTTTTGTLAQVSRLESADIDNKTKVDQVIEIGTNGIVGGVVNLGEFTGKFNRQAVSTKLLGLITAQKQSASAGTTTTWNYFNYSGAIFDYTRMIADAQGNIYGAWVALDAVLTKAMYETKNQGMVMESYECMGPQLTYINGYPVAKAYVIQAADVTAGLAPLSSVFSGALNPATALAEIPNKVLPPTTGNPPNSLYSSGRINFLKLTRIPSAAATIGGVTYGAGSIVRYRENQDYKVTAASMTTPGVQSGVTPTVNSLAAGTSVNYVGPELVVGASIVVDPGAGSTVQEVCTITAVSGSTITFTTTKTHSATGVTIALNPVSGRAVYNGLTGKIILGDALVAGDVLRCLFSSYDTNSTAKTIPTTQFDTVDADGIPARLTPVTILASQIPRVQSASITINIPRKQVQGAGEDEISYGTAGVPDIKYSLDVIPTDNTLLEYFSAGASGNGTNGDIYTLDYVARYMNTNQLPFAIIVKSPTANSKVLFSVTGAQPVFDNQGESGNANGELTQKFSGTDMSGSITISATT